MTNDLPRLTVDKLAQAIRASNEVYSAGRMAEALLTQLGVDDAGEYVLVPAERLDEAPREWMCLTHSSRPVADYEYCLRRNHLPCRVRWVRLVEDTA